MAEKRTRLDIIGDMLWAVTNKGGRIKPTHLMYKSNMSHRQMKPYLEELIEKSFIKRTKSDNCKYIIITQKGYDFINRLREIKEFEKAFGL